jgi:peptidoglycan/LPS O-acetylase OafA/YrhL
VAVSARGAAELYRLDCAVKGIRLSGTCQSVSWVLRMRPHINARFDIARGLCALVVFAGHTSQVFIWRLTGFNHPSAQVAGTMARHALLIFFLISGYLITRSISGNIRRNGYFDAIDYLASRVARIYPPLVVAIVITGVVAWLINTMGLPGSTEIEYGLEGDFYRVRNRFEFPLREIWTSLTMRGGLMEANGALWSLYIEFQVYLIAMGIAMMLATKPPLLRAIGGAITFLVLRFGLGAHPDFLFFGFIWFLGAFASIVPIKMAAFSKLFALSFLSALSLGTGLYDITLFSQGKDTRAGQFLQIMFCIVYLGVLISPTLERKYPPYLVRSGDFSYSLYAMHFPLLLFGLSVTQNWIGDSALRTAIVCIVSAMIIIVVVIGVAKIVEQTGRFKTWILRGASRLGF